MGSVNFLRDYHHRDRGFGAGERARNYFKHNEGPLTRRDRDKAGENRVAQDRVEQQAAAPEHVGKRGYQHRQQVAEPDHREHRAKVRLRDLEPRLDLLERETQQRAIVFIEKSRGRRDPEYPALPPGERRRPAQQSKLDTLASVFLSRSAAFGFQIRRDAGSIIRIQSIATGNDSRPRKKYDPL